MNGANVFAPGIVSTTQFKENDLIVVKNLKGTILAIGLAIIDSEIFESNRKESGTVFRNIHYLHDELWNFQY